jgi:hypothetical protein
MSARTIPMLLIAFLIGFAEQATCQTTTLQPRTVVTSDGEVDDFDSFIRLLLYANELNIVGLVYSSSEFHYAGDGKGSTFTSNMPFAKQYGTRTTLRWLGTEWMQDFIDKYAMVYDNLLKHDKNYPAPQHLKSLIKVGNINFEGEMDHDTEGSDYIKKLLLDNNPVPLHLQIWGGTNTVARALKSIEVEYKNTPQWKSIYKNVCNKATLNIILDQDETYKKYVSVHWADINVVYNTAQFWCLAYPWDKMIPSEKQSYLDGNWFAENIKFNHGPLTSNYFLWGDGQKLAADPDHTHGDTAEARKNGKNQYAFISEGDSPSYLYLINTGLRNIENPSYGGWGGRFVQSKTKSRLWQDGRDVTDYNFFNNKEDAEFPQARWVDAIQNDFAARADWCVKSYKDANHAPTVNLKHAANLNVKPGQVVQLSGMAKDPDGNTLSYQWWQYEEAGTYKGKVAIQNADKSSASFTVPTDATAGRTIHIILQVTDNGTPALTRYQRVIARVAK